MTLGSACVVLHRPLGSFDQKGKVMPQVPQMAASLVCSAFIFLHLTLTCAILGASLFSPFLPHFLPLLPPHCPGHMVVSYRGNHVEFVSACAFTRAVSRLFLLLGMPFLLLVCLVPSEISAQTSSPGIVPEIPEWSGYRSSPCIPLWLRPLCAEIVSN